MKKLALTLVFSFFSALVFAASPQEVDAAIISNLDFIEHMDLLENQDALELLKDSGHAGSDLPRPAVVVAPTGHASGSAGGKK